MRPSIAQLFRAAAVAYATVCSCAAGVPASAQGPAAGPWWTGPHAPDGTRVQHPPDVLVGVSAQPQQSALHFTGLVEGAVYELRVTLATSESVFEDSLTIRVPPLYTLSTTPEYSGSAWIASWTRTRRNAMAVAVSNSKVRLSLEALCANALSLQPATGRFSVEISLWDTFAGLSEDDAFLTLTRWEQDFASIPRPTIESEAQCTGAGASAPVSEAADAGAGSVLSQHEALRALQAPDAVRRGVQGLMARLADTKHCTTSAAQYVVTDGHIINFDTYQCDSEMWKRDVWDFACKTPSLAHKFWRPAVTVGDLHLYSLTHIDLAVVHVFFSHRLSKPGVFVEVGAQDGVSNSNTVAMERCLGWKGLLVEASVCAECEAARHRPGSAVEPCAIAPCPSGAIEIGGDSGFCQGFHADEACLKAAAGPLKRNCSSLAAVLAKHEMQFVDFMSIDIEGYSLFALRSIDFAAVRIAVIVIELSDCGPSVRSFASGDKHECMVNNGDPQGDIFRQVQALLLPWNYTVMHLSQDDALAYRADLLVEYPR